MKFTTIADAVRQTGLSYLGSVNMSAKLAKNGKVNQNTYGICLAPANTSGYNVCSHSTPECRMGCLATSGHAGMEMLAGITKIKSCRIKKTRLFYEQPEFFMAWLIAEISAAKMQADAQGHFFSVRLNCTSDIDWQNVLVDGKSVFEIFPDVQFYDYTKNPNKFFVNPKNYHLTYSYTGRNWKTVIAAEHDAIEVYHRLAQKTHGKDPITYNLVLHILEEEIEHEDEFETLIA